MQDRLSKLVTIFADLDFRGSRAEGDDLLGDAYEYLMRHFATESGKSKGQFYTPAEVSRVLAKVVGIGPHTRQDQTVYDPTCGSGSLLLKVAAEAPRGITIYGQEKDNATWALSKMNMILHGNEDADIGKGDTLTSPQFTNGDELRTFDFAVANPPFSVKSWSNGLEQRLRPLRVRPAAGEERRLRLPAARSEVAQEHRQGGRHPAARRAVPRQRRGHHPQAAAPARLHQGHHRPARRTSSTAPASRPASSCSTRRTPQAAPASS